MVTKTQVQLNDATIFYWQSATKDNKVIGCS